MATHWAGSFGVFLQTFPRTFQRWAAIGLCCVVAGYVLGGTAPAQAELPAVCSCGCGMSLGSCDMKVCPARSQALRQHIKDVTGEVLQSRKRELNVTSEYRANSEAHKAGAIDISSKNLSAKDRHSDALAISKKLGSNFRVVVEEVDAKTNTQTNTTYQGGVKGRTRTGLEKRATATHTHIQPVLPKPKK
jgi:hypothetical protein